MNNIKIQLINHSPGEWYFEIEETEFTCNFIVVVTLEETTWGLQYTLTPYYQICEGPFCGKLLLPFDVTELSDFSPQLQQL